MRARIRSRAFVISLVAVAVLIIAVMSVGANIPDDPDRVGVVGQQPPGAVETLALRDEITIVEIEPDATPSDAEGYADLIDAEDLDVVVADGDTIYAGSDRPVLLAMINDLWTGARLVERLGAEGLDAEEITAELAPLDVRLTNTDEPDDDDGSGLVVVVLLFIAVQTAGGYIMMGILEEKGTRIVELLLSSVSAAELLVAKVLGIGAIGLIQMAVMVASAWLAATINGLAVPALRPDTLAVGVLWFVIGYLLYGSLFAAAAALAPSQEDSQSTVAPVAILVMMSYFASVFAAAAPEGVWTNAVTLFPTVAPFAMPARMVAGDVSWLEMGAALVLSLATTALVFAFSARVYVRSVLHTDRRIGWLESLRLSD